MVNQNLDIGFLEYALREYEKKSSVDVKEIMWGNEDLSVREFFEKMKQDTLEGKELYHDFLQESEDIYKEYKKFIRNIRD